MSRPEQFPENLFVRVPRGTGLRVREARGQEAVGSFLRNALLTTLDAIDARESVPRPDRRLHERVSARLASLIRRERFALGLAPGAACTGEYLRGLEAAAFEVAGMVPLGSDLVPHAKTIVAA